MNRFFKNIIYTTASIFALFFQLWGAQVEAKSFFDEVTPFTVEVVTTDINCPDVCDGSALAVVTGGTPPFTFLWNNNDTRQHLDWEPPGYYEVTVTDADGHSGVAGGTINAPAPIVIDLSINMPGGCIAGSTADVMASASGGTPGYTYEWSNGAFGSTVTGLPTGSYWVTVTDSQGCKQGRNFAVARGGLQVDVNVDPGVCGANNGTATAVVTGGTAPYSYLLQPGNIRTQTVTGLAPGTYTFYVRDATGCKGEHTFEIPLSGDLIVNAAARDISCGGTNDGSVQAMATRGTPPYNYVWTNTSSGVVIGNTAGVDDLAADTYTVIVTDNGGCSGTETVTVRDRPIFTLDTDSTPADCGVSNGTASVTVTGGTPPFTYRWCDGQTTPTATGFSGSVCWVEVTDALGCMDRATVTIGENSDLGAQIDSTTNASCGLSNGTATASGLLGTPPYSYAWCNGQTTQTAINLPAGFCTVTITDSNNCRATATANIGQDNDLDVTIVPDPGDCDAPPTAATASVAGGTAPFAYLWSDGQITERADNLTPGTTISVTVTDATGCSGVDTLMLPNDPLTINPDFDWEFLECFNNDSMRIQFNDLTNATGANCSWDFGDGQTATGANPIVVLAASPATVTLSKTAGNCSGSSMKDVMIPYLDVSISGPGNGCIGDLLTASAVNNSGATITSYDWFPDDLIVSGDGTSDVVVSSDSAGTFQICVAVMSDLGCIDTICTDYTVDSKRVIQADIITYAQCDSFLVSFGGISDVTWYFGTGDSSILDNPSYMYPDTGTYKVIIVPNDPCIDTICKTITVLPLNVDFTCDLVQCVDTCLLSLMDISQLPAPVKSWKWTVIDSAGGNMQMDTVQNPNFNITESGIYTITMEVTFGSGDSCCVKSISKTKEITCFNPPGGGTCKQTVCYGDTTKLTFVGADPDLIFTFPQDSCLIIDSTGAVCFIAAKDDTTIVFPVIVTSGNGECTGTTNYTITVPPKIEIEILGDTIVCDSTPVELIVSGAGAYSYQWSESPDFDTIFSMNDTVFVVPGRPTTYYVMATDSAGCSEIAMHTVGNYEVGIEIQGTPIICIGDSTVLTLQNTHARDTLDIIWSPLDVIVSGQGTNTVTVMPLDNAVISVEATNQFGCMATDTFAMQVNNANEGLEITASLDTIYDHETTDLFTTEGYETYEWNPESTLDPVDVANPTASPDVSTLYELTVTDEEGCIGNAEILITVLSPPCGRPHVFLPNAFTPNNDRLNDVLYVRGNIVDDVHLMVFNRWGEKVFETRDQSIGWDGTWGDKGVCPDVYGYYLTVRCFNGEDYVEKGNITVLK